MAKIMMPDEPKRQRELPLKGETAGDGRVAEAETAADEAIANRRGRRDRGI